MFVCKGPLALQPVHPPLKDCNDRVIFCEEQCWALAPLRCGGGRPGGHWAGSLDTSSYSLPGIHTSPVGVKDTCYHTCELSEARNSFVFPETRIMFGTLKFTKW